MFGRQRFTIYGLICEGNGKEVPLQSINTNVTIGHMISHVESTLTYKNDSPDAIETVFKFPLDESSAVYKMVAEIDGRIITAECQEKEQAKKTYDQAIEHGNTAFLLREDDHSGDIFLCSLGNIPSQKEVKLTISYVAELSPEVDKSVRFALPSVLNPRYKSSESESGQGFGFGQPVQPIKTIESGKGGYSFSVNITIQSQVRIESIRSMDQLTVNIDEPSRNSAKASFSSEDCKLKEDIFLNILYENCNQPVAMIERGSSKQEGLMKSDVLLLNFYPEMEEKARKNGEYIFVIDRSGSMGGDRIMSAKQTLMLLVKSLRQGCYFNIVSFGSNFDSLFEKSQAYNKESLLRASQLIETMDADMGGTEMQRPLKKIFSDPLIPEQPRQIFVITDGAISNVDSTLELVKQNSKTARVFSVGIGEGASTALVKGLARAGNGRSEFVYGEDRLQQKVMSLMKFSLQPEVQKLSLDWSLSPGVTATMIPQQIRTIFVGELLTVYAIITGAERIEIICGSVKLTGEINGQPFEYQMEFEGQGLIDDTSIASPIHRLAAKTLIKDLEIEEKGGNKKSDIVLASTAANVISKYTSFVGVDKESKVPIKQINPDDLKSQGGFFLGSAPRINMVMACPPPPAMSFGAATFGSAQVNMVKGKKKSRGFGGPPPPPPPPLFGSAQPEAVCFGGGFGAPAQGEGGFGAPTQGGGGFGAPTQGGGGFGAPTQGGGGFGAPTQGGGMFGAPTQGGGGFGAPTQGGGGFGAAPATSGFGAPAMGGFGGPPPGSALFGGFSNSANIQSGMMEDSVIAVISLQDFDGSWSNSEQLSNLLGFPQSTLIPPGGSNTECWVTCIVLAWLEIKHSNRKDEWELIYNKADDWLTSMLDPKPLVDMKHQSKARIQSL